jgi:uncharacterized protein
METIGKGAGGQPGIGPQKKPTREWSLRAMRQRILALPGHPREVAAGLAIGVFVGMTPTTPLQSLLAIVFCFLLKKSKLAAFMGTWVSNPLTLPVIYFCDYEVGRIITGVERPSLLLSDFSLQRMLDLGIHIVYPLLIGGLFVGLLAAIPAYFISRKILHSRKPAKKEE